MNGCADTSTTATVNEPQLAEVREERLAECLLHAIECLLYCQAVKVDFGGDSARLPRQVDV
jgi:hypothetical protein